MILRRKSTNEDFILSVDDFEREAHSFGIFAAFEPYDIVVRHGRTNRYTEIIIEHELIARFPAFNDFQLIYGFPASVTQIPNRTKKEIMQALNNAERRIVAEGIIKHLSPEAVDLLQNLRNAGGVAYSTTPMMDLDAINPSSHYVRHGDPALKELRSEMLVTEVWDTQIGHSVVRITPMGVIVAEKLRRV